MKSKVPSFDPVRQRLLDLVGECGTNLANVSRAIGKNHAYLHQYINREKPKQLPEMVRHALAHHFSVEEDELLSSVQKLERNRLGRRVKSKGGGGPAYLHSFAARLSHSRAESDYGAPLAFAQAAGIELDRYLVLEDGADNPSLDELDRISRVSGKSLEWLIRGDLSARKLGQIGTQQPIDFQSKRRQ